jgi:hypothetical protein
MLKHEGNSAQKCQFGCKFGTRTSENKGTIESYFGVPNDKHLASTLATYSMKVNQRGKWHVRISYKQVI